MTRACGPKSPVHYLMCTGVGDKKWLKDLAASQDSVRIDLKIKEPGFILSEAWASPRLCESKAKNGLLTHGDKTVLQSIVRKDFARWSNKVGAVVSIGPSLSLDGPYLVHIKVTYQH
jgi:hypothetical protein